MLGFNAIAALPIADDIMTTAIVVPERIAANKRGSQNLNARRSGSTVISAGIRASVSIKAIKA